MQTWLFALALIPTAQHCPRLGPSLHASVEWMLFIWQLFKLGVRNKEKEGSATGCVPSAQTPLLSTAEAEI